MHGAGKEGPGRKRDREESESSGGKCRVWREERGRKKRKEN